MIYARRYCEDIDYLLEENADLESALSDVLDEMTSPGYIKAVKRLNRIIYAEGRLGESPAEVLMRIRSEPDD